MFKKLIKNRKGTAEVIGSIMFIVILLFFFTNVYLWHDAATKEMNDSYVEKINTPITISLADNSQLNVTNKGGSDATLTMLWVDIQSPSGGPDKVHLNFTISDNDKVVPAGSSILIPEHYTPTDKTVYKVITTLGNSATCYYP